jgi:hypothetical protein
VIQVAHTLKPATELLDAVHHIDIFVATRIAS